MQAFILETECVLKMVRWIIYLGESEYYESVGISKRHTTAVTVERFSLSTSSHVTTLKKDVSSFKTEVNEMLMELFYSAESQSVQFRICLASATALLFKSIGFCRKFAFFVRLAGLMYREVYPKAHTSSHIFSLSLCRSLITHRRAISISSPLPITNSPASLITCAHSNPTIPPLTYSRSPFLQLSMMVL
jgi:hypothetical protein